MPRSDDSFERLRAAIDELAAADAADLLAEARIEARARIRATLTDALAHSMLERLHEQLPEPVDEPPASPTRRDTRADPPPTPQHTLADPQPPRREARPVPAPRHPTPAGEPAWYVYGVVSSGTELGGALPGIDPTRPVTLLREDALAAVTSRVPLEEFDEARLREHLADMTWVETTARAHEAVLDRVREQTTVIPMRMCTVYRTDGGVREMLRREAEPLLEAIDHLRGTSEWGLKAFIEPESSDAASDEAAGSSSGAAYMERKRTERERRERAVEAADDAAVTIHERLSALAGDAQVLALQRPEASGHHGAMILNGAYLVADEDTEAFHDAVRSLQAELEPQGFELVPTGPWPAYNFVPGTIGAAW
jgi:hypothetical protein